MQFRAEAALVRVSLEAEPLPQEDATESGSVTFDDDTGFERLTRPDTRAELPFAQRRIQLEHRARDLDETTTRCVCPLDQISSVFRP